MRHGWPRVLLVLLGALGFAAAPARAVTVTYTPVPSTHDVLFNNMNSDFAVTSGPANSLWFTEPENGAKFPALMAQLTMPTGSTAATLTQTAMPDVIDEPMSVAPGADGALYFTVQNEDAIDRYDPATQKVTSITSGISAGASPQDIVRGPDGNLWFTELNGDAIAKLVVAHGATPAAVTEYHLADPKREPTGLTVGPDNNLWFTEAGPGGGIGRITTGGAIGPTYRNLVKSDLNGPTAIAPGPDGNLWFTGSTTGGYVGRITLAGAWKEFTIDEVSVEPGPVAGPDGGVWVIDKNFHKLIRVEPSTGAMQSFDSPNDGGGGLEVGPVLGPDGNLWAVARFGQIERIDIGGTTPTTTAPQATTGAATSVTQSSAVLNGTVAAGNTSTSATFDFGTSTAYGHATASATVTGTAATPFHATLTGLSPGTTYHFRLRAQNAKGSSTGADVTFTTAEGSTPPPGGGSPKTATVKLTGSHTLTVKGGRLSLPLSCPKGRTRCTGTAKLTEKVKLKARKGRKAKTRTVTLGSKGFSIGAGKTSTLKVSLNKAGRSALAKARGHRLKVTLAIGGKNLKGGGRVTLKAAPVKKKKTHKHG